MLKQLGAAEDAAVAALWLVRLDARARAGFWLLGLCRLLWMRSYTTFGLRCTGDEDSLSRVALASSATADAVLAERTLIAAMWFWSGLGLFLTSPPYNVPTLTNSTHLPTYKSS